MRMFNVSFRISTFNNPSGCLRTSDLLTNFKTASDATVLTEKRFKMLGINLGGRLNFDSHVDMLIEKASK